MTTPADESDLRAEVERLRAENALLWRAYDLSLGCPYQGEPGGTERWMAELSSAQDALREASSHRDAAGLSARSTSRR